MNSITQKTVTVNKTEYGKKNLFIAINKEANDFALKTLSSNAYKIYIYIASNQDRYVFQLSSKDVQLRCGIKSWKTYSSAIKELQDKKYLIRTDDILERYNFFDKPAYL